MAEVISRNRVVGSDVVRWLAFSLLCAGALGSAVLVLPPASLLIPVSLLRRVPRKKRKVAWQLIVPVIAGVALGVLGGPSTPESRGA
ncbi:hypothetical protein [Streptomyces sp. NPDC048225]|uniref:hypothetical protein n=1 Tax=Streptomyces sp. NPDC048225 TaxID=3365518 RepID=UPI003717F0EB